MRPRTVVAFIEITRAWWHQSGDAHIRRDEFAPTCASTRCGQH